ESNPGTNAAVARRLLRDGAFAVVEGSTAAAGSAGYLRDQGVPVTGPATDPAWPQHDNVVSYSNAFTGAPVSTWGDFVRDRQGTRAAVVSIESLPSSQALAERTVTSLGARGIAVPVVTTISAIDPDVDALVARLRAQRIDTLVASLDSVLLPAVVAAATEAGIRPKVIVVPVGYDQAMASRHGGTLAGG
nr:ABC transporter substrate-binding protein [Micromonospora sp. DSM 115978]